MSESIRTKITLIEQVASDAIIDKAYQWLCRRRKKYSHNNDVWHLRWVWPAHKPLMQAALLGGRYRFAPVRVIVDRGEKRLLWCARDALVLKAIALVLGEHLRPHLFEHIYHLADSGGAKAAVRQVYDELPKHRFVFRTDVKSYYASIDHSLLLGQLRGLVKDNEVMRLLSLYLQHMEVCGGVYREVLHGLSLGCPLSPLMGALFLKPLDDAMARMGLPYVRFMDDWVILAPKRWKLRQAVAKVNCVLHELQLLKHPDKTFIGYIARGFDFLGYHFSPQGLAVAQKTIANCVDKIVDLYRDFDRIRRVEVYIKAWLRWLYSGMTGLSLVGFPTAPP